MKLSKRGTEAGGFTLVELMVVILVLGTLIGMAIPSILTVRKAGNEVATIASLRTLSGAQSVHRNRFGVYGSIDDLVSRRLVDPTYQSLRATLREELADHDFIL